MFEKLQARLVKQGKAKSKSLPNGVKIKLADGSVSSQILKVVQIDVSKNLNEFTNSIPLTFLVVKGSHCLIGRHSLQKLYPRQFNAFKQVTSQNVKAYDKLSQAKVKPVRTVMKKSNSVSNIDNSVICQKLPSLNKAMSKSNVQSKSNSNIVISHVKVEGVKIAPKVSAKSCRQKLRVKTC